MIDQKQLELIILENLTTEMDPEIGTDVVRMKLVDDLVVEPGGRVSYSFWPSSLL